MPTLTPEGGRLPRKVILIRGSILLLVVVGIVAVVSFALQLLFTRDVLSIQEQIDAEQEEVDVVAAREVLLLSIKLRLSAVDALPPRDTAFVQTIEAYRRAFGRLGEVENLSLEKNRVTFSLSFSSSDAIKDFLDAVTDPGAKQDFSTITIDGISRSRDGMFRLTVTAERA